MTGGMPETGLRIGRRLVGGFVRRRWDVSFRGQGHVPDAGPVILASNHIGWLDGPLLIASSPRPAHALVKREEFTGKTGWLLRSTGQIKVDRDATDAGALRAAQGALEAGQCVVIYPEGQRGGGEFERFKGGVSWLALTTGAPIVPVAIFGTRRPGEPPETRAPKGAHIDVVYGAPLTFPMQEWPRTREMLDDAGAQILEHLRAHVSWSKDTLQRDLPGPLPRGTSDA